MPRMESRIPLSARLRSALFNAVFPVWTIGISAACLPLMLRKGSAGAAPAGRLWAIGVLFLLRTLCRVRYEVRGTEHLPKDKPCIVACKHYSAWETMIFLHFFRHPAYVLKKELLSVPLFGRFLLKLQMIVVDREGGAKEIRGMQRASAERLAEGRHVVIFPEGTRVPVGAAPAYQPGVAFLYASAPEGVPVVPAALNSGVHWSAHRKDVRPGVILLEFLPAIEPGLPRKAFMERLERAIEEKSAALADESRAAGRACPDPEAGAYGPLAKP
jgi:1-acyl-sn-glycerol-3-phosphate acyltransferase